jgi:glycopeptide antibiotics resistance protein
MNEETAIENAGEEAAQEVSALTEALALTGDYRLDWWKWLVIGFAALLLLYLVIRLSLYIFKIIGAIMCVACGVAGGYLAQAILNPVLAERLPENATHLAPIISGAIGFLVFYGLAATIVLLIRKPAQPLEKKKE